jgi:hypothetical protein
METIHLISRTFIDSDTGIKCEVDEATKKVSLTTGIGSGSRRFERAEFVFKDSKPETVIKVAESFIRLMKNI